MSKSEWMGMVAGCLVFFGILFLSSSVFSQKTAFSGDSAKFQGELTEYFRNAPDNEKKLMEPVLEDFFLKWYGEKFDAAQKKIIYAISNEMVKRKIRPYPDFFGYFVALNVFRNSSQPDHSFVPWSTILIKLLEEIDNRKYLSFIEFSTYLFEDRTLYKSATTKWKIVVPSMKFHFDSVPSLIFPVADLVCYANKDSLNIYRTKGVYYPLTHQWRGEGGGVDWRRAGEDPAKVFALLKRFSVQMKFSKFEADSVTFTHTKYFKSPIQGKYLDKVLADVTEEKASYPRFYSYDKRIGIAQLFKDVDFLGGFAMEGGKIIGSGNEGRDALLTFKKGNKDFVITGSDFYVIRPDRVNSQSASVTIYHEGDSIYHPGLQLKYLDEIRELSLTKDERMARVSPWYDSYHQVEIYCEALYWKLGEGTVSFQVMKGPAREGKAVIESSSYYSMPRYEKLQGIDEQNPLLSLKLYCDRNKTRQLKLADLSAYLKIPVEQVENQLLNLALYGFLVYDSDRKTAIVKNKLFDYVNAFNGKSDYDGIVFNSLVEKGANAVLSLDSFELRVKGVEKVVLSEAQTVQIFPLNKEVRIKKGMDFSFTGRTEAGMFDFYAKDSYFDYDKFRMNLPDIDSMQFYVFGKKPDPKTGKLPLQKVKTSINHLSGVLQIDDPKNKSGLKSYPQYPVFTNSREAFAYWDQASVQKGVYDRERFFYKLNPFTIQRLDDLDPDTLQFSGMFNSGGILPELTDQLKVRPDNSLGLEKQTDSAGLPVYGGKGQLIARIDLSNKGLKGEGRLTCLNSETVSKDFLFLPDSMKTVANRFSIAEQVSPSLPKVSGDSVQQFWLPGSDSMLVSSTRKPMAMYREQSMFNGTLALTPLTLSGDGTVKIRDADMDSRGFMFKDRTFDALIANFRIKSYDLADLTISTRNYQTHFDFDTRKGEFKSNVGISKVDFPINKYSCSMDRFDWLIDNEEIMLTNERKLAQGADTLNLTQLIDVGYTGSEFVSVHPLQDSLKFFAARARYHLRTNIINAEDVRIIKVADAAIYPDSGKVTILKDAVMPPLQRAIIIANTESRNHQFYNSGVSIASRKNYTARGDYDYADRTGNRQKIVFDRVRVDSSGQTVAFGMVSDSMDFTLSPEFAFMGEVSLRSKEKRLMFKGGFHPVTNCFASEPQWVRFESLIDPQKVRIPVSFPLRNTDREPVTLGILFQNSQFGISPSFFRPRISFSDSIMSTAEGFVEYNVPTNEFRVAAAEKLNDVSLPGPYLSLNTWNCKMRGEGKINLSMVSEPMKIESYGYVDHFVIPDSTLVHCAMMLDFPFSEPGLQRFSDQLNAINLTGIKLTETNYPLFLRAALPEAEYTRVKGELDLMGRYRKFPDELARSIALADVKLSWDSVSKSYISSGLIGVASIGKVQVNKYIKGVVEFSRKRNGDEFTIYLELTRNDWFFFNYRNKVMNAFSSDLTFNDILREAAQSGAEQKRVRNLAKGYTYSLGTERKKRDFLRKFEQEETE